MASLKYPPLVNAVTVSIDEIDIQQEVANEFNNYAMKLAAQGVTVLATSGDNGANGKFGLCGIMPQFPATSPYVTAVGATMVTRDSCLYAAIPYAHSS